MTSEKLTAQAWEVVRSVLIAEDVNVIARPSSAAHEIVRVLNLAGLIADRDDLLAMTGLASRQLQRFTERGHPGGPCRRTGWIEERHIDEEWDVVRGVQERL